MSIYRHVKTLLLVSDDLDESQTGNTYTVLPSDGDNTSDRSQQWRVFFDLYQDGGSTSPTTDATLQTSHNGVDWIIAAQATQLTADGEIHEFKDVEALGPYVRAVTVLGGSTTPSHNAVVKLASNGSFRLLVR